MKPTNRHVALAIAGAAALISAQSIARSANQLTDLVGARGSSGESELEARGFTHITGHAGSRNTMHTYWWHPGDKNCIHVETNGGRYTSISDASKSDCNQKDGGSGAAVAIAAIAGVALIAALASHKSDHHDDGKHYSNSDDEARYERGFNDGLYNSSYHNYERSDAYSNGYQAGVAQRNVNTGQHYGRGGYAPVGAYADLGGARASSADDEMNRRGFTNVDSFKSGNTAYTIWNRRDSHQCVQMTVADGSVYDIRDIGSHPNCR